MTEYLLDELFSHIHKDNAEEIWLNILNKYELEFGNTISFRHAETKWTLLHYASENIFFLVAAWLIERGAEVDALDFQNNTPFLIGLDAAIDAAVQSNEKQIDFSVVSLLLTNGANEAAVSSEGLSKEGLLRSYGKYAAEQYNLMINNISR